MDASRNRIHVSVMDRRSAEHDHVDGDRYADLLDRTLRAEGVVPPAEVTLLWVDRDEMSELKGTHLGIDEPTDVLSFPLDGAEGTSELGGPQLVGDVVICPAVAAAQAPQHAGQFDDEVALLVVHGGLHLVGHDHAAPGERDRMWNRERELLTTHWGEFARDPWGEMSAS